MAKTANPEPTIVVLRRAVVPADRKPRRILPGDYFAVVINSKANHGNVPAITSYFDHSMAPTWGEVPVQYYWHSVPATIEETPPALIQSFQSVEPVGPVEYRHRIRRSDLDKMWKR